VTAEESKSREGEESEERATASAEVWTGVVNALNRRYPGRGITQQFIDESIRLVGELESLMRGLAVMEKKHGRKKA
jgi:hypothetical protein